MNLSLYSTVSSQEISMFETQNKRHFAASPLISNPSQLTVSHEGLVLKPRIDHNKENLKIQNWELNLTDMTKLYVTKRK